MKIKQFRYSADNLGYLLYAKGEGIAVDAGAAAEIMKFAKSNQIKIKYVTNTHSHHDHTPGNEKLLKASGAAFIDSRQVSFEQTISVGGESLSMIPTPGHTEDSISFAADDFIITGDTLFNGTVGNCFSGDLKAFFCSLKRLISFSPETNIFAGHDYVVESLNIAKQLEPENIFIDRILDDYDPGYIVSTIGDELKVNPYLRFNIPGIVKLLKDKNLPAATEFDRFKSMMEYY